MHRPLVGNDDPILKADFTLKVDDELVLLLGTSRDSFEADSKFRGSDVKALTVGPWVSQLTTMIDQFEVAWEECNWRWKTERLQRHASRINLA